MPIDTSIYNQLLQKPKTIQDFDNEAQTAQLNRLALQGEQNKMADYQRGLAGEAALSKALASGGDVTNALAQGGFGKQAMAYQKQALDAKKTQSDIGHVDAQAADLTQKTVQGKYDLERKKHDVALQEVTSFSNPADALASLNAHIAKGEMSAEEGAQMRQSIPTDPAAFKQWQMQTVKGLLDAKERYTYMAPNANTLATNTTSIATNAATNATSRANNAATQAGEDRRAAQSRETQLTVNGMGKDGQVSGDVEAMAQAIATGKLAPINGFALAKPRGQAIMARAMEINPSYDAGDYAAKNNALKGFSTGKEGTALRSFNVATDHLETLGTMADALNNGNIQLLNKAGNMWNQQTGAAAPTNFNAVKEIVGKEVVKAIVAGGGGVDERKEMSSLLDAANSPAQLKGVITHFKELMGAQRDGLMDQYQRTTGRTDGAAVFAPSKHGPKAADNDIHAQADAILKGGK